MGDAAIMITSADIILNAYHDGLAIPAFNIPYLPMMEPVIRAVVDQDSVAFIETARLEWYKFEAGGPDQIMAEYQKWHDLAHTRLHLDHIPVIDEDDVRVDYVPIIETAITLGFDSVMIDGSRLHLDGNIAATRQIVELAHRAGISCEAELGAVLGHEAGPQPSYEELFATGRGFTDVEEARHFVHETGCDWLSVAVGSIHGANTAGFTAGLERGLQRMTEAGRAVAGSSPCASRQGDVARRDVAYLCCGARLYCGVWCRSIGPSPLAPQSNFCRKARIESVITATT